MDEKDFSLRLARLREKKGVSARDMSLSIGQNSGYINSLKQEELTPLLKYFSLYAITCIYPLPSFLTLNPKIRPSLTPLLKI